ENVDLSTRGCPGARNIHLCGTSVKKERLGRRVVRGSSLAIGNVFCNAGDTVHNSALVADGKGPIADPPDAAVGAGDAVLLVVLTDHLLGHRGLHDARAV